jgi:predicted DNA-binding protein (MmcQ/YjbR family)
MVNTKTFRQLSLSFPNAVEQPHFNLTSFRINGKIFASLEINKSKACLKFSLDDQRILSSIDKAIYPVKNYCGKSSWTYIDIKNIREELMLDALASAYNEVSQLNSKKKK